MKKSYETVFILNPVLSENQIKSIVEKFKNLLLDNDSDIINEENWGLRKLAYSIEHKSKGFYYLFELNTLPSTIEKLETEFGRSETVMRFLTTSLDKHAIAYNEKRRSGAFNKKKTNEDKEASSKA